MTDIRDELYEGMVYEKHGVGAGELDEQATVELMRRGGAEIDRLRAELAYRERQLKESWSVRRDLDALRETGDET